MSAAKILMLMGRSNPFTYRAAWLHTIYVATTGNDTTGNGSKAAPYLTLTKAMTVAVAGDGILLADGTYAEKSGTGAAGYLTISKNLADWLVIEPELGAAGNVTISGTVGTGINIYFAPATTSSHLKFRYLNFGMAAGSTQLILNQATINTVMFENCILTPIDGAVSGYKGATVVNGLTFRNCTINRPPTTGDYYGVWQSIADTTSNLLFDGCTIYGSTDTGGTEGKAVYITGTLGGAIEFRNCTLDAANGFSIPTGGTVTFDGCTIKNVSACLLGVDGSGIQSDRLSTAIIKNCVISKDVAVVGHVLLVGHGACDSVVDNVTIDASYDYALVIKAHTGTEVKNCHLTGGSSSALLYKAAISPNAHHNVLVGTGTVGAFQLRNGDNGDKCATWRFENNIVNITGSSRALNIGNATHDLGGGICDYNQYQSNAGHLGIVRNDADVLNLAELQAAWADYDVTTNDSHSTVV